MATSRLIGYDFYLVRLSTLIITELIMATFFAILFPFLFIWVILFAICFAIVEFGQNYLYDETTPSSFLKITLGSAILAAVLTWTRTSYDTMLTRDIGKTIVLAVVAFAVFTLVFRFQPWHGFGIGIVSVLLFAGIATMAVESFFNRNAPPPSIVRNPAKPLRRAGSSPTVPVAEQAKPKS